MINQEIIDKLVRPLTEAVNANKEEKPASADNLRHRHVMDWPELMEKEGLPIRG
jgi:hypothetical protein